MSTGFEIGTTYTYEFRDGDRLFFTPTERLKNGNWRGISQEQHAGHLKRRPPKKVVVFDPPALPWMKVEG
jgi:hypothetical protein